MRRDWLGLNSATAYWAASGCGGHYALNVTGAPGDAQPQRQMSNTARSLFGGMANSEIRASESARGLVCVRCIRGYPGVRCPTPRPDRSCPLPLGPSKSAGDWIGGQAARLSVVEAGKLINRVRPAVALV
jgi:hypothetical protein